MNIYRIKWYENIIHTAWSRVLKKLTGFRLVKKFPAFYGTRIITNVKNVKRGRG